MVSCTSMSEGSLATTAAENDFALNTIIQYVDLDLYNFLPLRLLTSTIQEVQIMYGLQTMIGKCQHIMTFIVSTCTMIK